MNDVWCRPMIVRIYHTNNRYGRAHLRNIVIITMDILAKIYGKARVLAILTLTSAGLSFSCLLVSICTDQWLYTSELEPASLEMMASRNVTVSNDRTRNGSDTKQTNENIDDDEDSGLKTPHLFYVHRYSGLWRKCVRARMWFSENLDSLLFAILLLYSWTVLCQTEGLRHKFIYNYCDLLFRL